MTGAAPASDGTLMTLAGIAYGSPDKISSYIAAAKPVAGWQVVWLPAVTDAPPNFAFLATDPATGTSVLGIRGTYPNPLSSAYWEDGKQDSPFGDMVDWPGAAGAKISGGTAEALANLWALQDASGTSLCDAIRALPADKPIIITGHSLGGTLTPVVALKLVETLQHDHIYATSFAGMTPGNGAFAALFGAGTAIAGRTRRVFNTLDSVGYGWNHVLATRNFYTPAPKGGLLVKLFLLIAAVRLKLGGYGYTAIGTPIPLKGQVRPPTISSSLIAYVFENLHQHMPDTYLALLGAPALPFSILFGTIVGSKDADAITKASDRPVIHL